MAYWGSRDAKPSPNFFDSLELHIQPDIQIKKIHNAPTTLASAFPGAGAFLHFNPVDTLALPATIRPANTLRIYIPETSNTLSPAHAPPILTSALRLTRLARNSQPTLP